jgi:TonB family protein
MLRQTSRTAGVLVATLAAVSACATPGRPPREQLLTRSGAPEGRRCSVVAEPARLPDAAELVDVPALRAEAARAWTAAGKPAGYALFSIRHSAEGLQVRRAVIESTIPAALTDTLQGLVFALRRQTPPTPGDWVVRLRVDAGEEMALRVGRSLQCAPRPRDGEYHGANDAFDVRQARSEETAWVRVRLNAEGQVTAARLERSPARSNGEQLLLNQVRTMSFFPALEDGQPIAGELVLRVPVSKAR